MHISEVIKIQKINRKRAITKYSEIFVKAINKKNEEKFKGNINKGQQWLMNEVKRKSIVSQLNIFKSASGIIPKIGGFVWKFIESKDLYEHNIFKSEKAKNVFLNIKYNKNPIVAYNLDGDPIKIFKNVFDALVWLQKNLPYDDRSYEYRSIIYVCKNPDKQRTIAKYQWRFYNDVKKY